MSDRLHRGDRPVHGLDRPNLFQRITRRGSLGHAPPPSAVAHRGRDGAEPRVLELDGLRGVACVAIVLYHMRPQLVPYGWSSVDLFFVLSGYLITAILIRHEGAPRLLQNFYIRRGLRIWPVYYLTILALVIAGPLLPWRTSWRGLGYYLSYTQNLPLYWSGQVPPFSPYALHLWTLANEEQFYIVWPLLVVTLGRRSVIPLGIGLAAMSVAARARGFDSWLLVARADGFALGGILAAMLAHAEKCPDWQGAYRRGLAGLTLVASAVVAFVIARGLLPSFGRPPVGAGFSLLAINGMFAGIIGLVAMHAGRPMVAWLRRPRLVHLGKLSYGLYVYHFIIFSLGGDLLLAIRGQGRTSLTNIPLILLTYAAAAASWAWLEKPLLDLKSRFSYRPSGMKQEASTMNSVLVR
jgi:peptidoglycan/LPS O-acetylase OafA/YrhL